MRKGFTSEELIDFIQNIRNKNEIKLYLNLIAGFPTETIEDVKETLEVLKQLKPYMIDICRYTNSTFVDSNSYEQLNPTIIQEHTRIYEKTLQKRKVETRIVGSGYKHN